MEQKTLTFRVILRQEKMNKDVQENLREPGHTEGNRNIEKQRIT